MVFVTHDVREGCCSVRASGCSTVGGWRSWERRKVFAAAQSRQVRQFHGSRLRLFDSTPAMRAKCGLLLDQHIGLVRFTAIAALIGLRWVSW